MASDPNSILAINQPTLEIKRISYLDVESLNKSSVSGESDIQPINGASSKTTTGLIAPHVEIDNYQVPAENIISLNINQDGFLPEISLSFIDGTGAFAGMYFPRTNPLVKVYIKALNPVLKPIRADYLITNVSGSEIGSTYDAGRVQTMYTITGSLYIPGIYGNTVLSIPKKKSWEALKWIAEYLKIGFATNETSTNDEMTWLNPNDTLDNFIKNICDRAYKDEKSFFGCFIDTNYILNFINYSKCLDKTTKITTVPGAGDLTQSSDISGLKEGITQDNAPKEYKEGRPIVLTSSITRSQSGFHIFNYEMVSNHGEVLANQNYKKSVIWHDRAYYLENKQEIEHFVEPLSDRTTESTHMTYQKPKLETFTKNEKSVRWLGLDYNNGHVHYKFAKLINQHNLDELDKNYLVVWISGVNQSIIRGAKIGVDISRMLSTEPNAVVPDGKFGAQLNSKLGQTEETDLYLTGPYVVKDIKYFFDGMATIPEKRYYTQLTLIRRDWVELAENNKLNSEKTQTSNG